MEFLFDNWLLILVALGSGTMLFLPRLQGQQTGMTAAAVVQLINRERAVVVDVSEPEEYARSHIRGAKSVPFGQLQEQLPRVVKNKATPVVLVCPTGARAGRAVAVARKLGYEGVHSLSGGLKSWQQADLPVVEQG